MKILNGTLSPIPFLEKEVELNHNKEYAFGQIYPLIVYDGHIPSFQVILSSDCVEITSVFLRNFDTFSYDNLSVIEENIELNVYNDFTLLRYNGYNKKAIPDSFKEGRYFLAISIAYKADDSTIHRGGIFSDIFTLTRNNKYISLEYSNPYNFEIPNGIIDFSNDFKFQCYLCTTIGKPEYTFEEEATERMGRTFIESQVSKKVYRFNILAPEYMCDALRLVRLCANKKIVEPWEGGRTFDLTTFSMDPEWQEQGDLASVECEFETDNIIANAGGYISVDL